MPVGSASHFQHVSQGITFSHTSSWGRALCCCLQCHISLPLLRLSFRAEWNCSSELSVKFLLNETSPGADKDGHTEGCSSSSSREESAGKNISEVKMCESGKAFSSSDRLTTSVLLQQHPFILLGNLSTWLWARAPFSPLSPARQLLFKHPQTSNHITGSLHRACFLLAPVRISLIPGELSGL